MLVIRYFRTGKKNHPFFKIIVTDKRKPPKGGRFVDTVGFWNPLTKENKIDKERVNYWISKGAKPSLTVHNLLVSKEIIKGEKIAVHKKSKKPEEKKESSDPALEKTPLAGSGEKSSSVEKIKKEEPEKETSKETEFKEQGAQKEVREEEFKKEEPKKETKEEVKEEVKEGAKDNTPENEQKDQEQDSLKGDSDLEKKQQEIEEK